MAAKKATSGGKSPRKAAPGKGEKRSAKKVQAVRRKKDVPETTQASGSAGHATDKYDQPGAPWWKKFVPTGLR